MVITKGKYFSLFSNCIAVKGAMRSTICDLERNQLTLISNHLFDFLMSCKTEEFLDVWHRSDFDIHEELKEFILFLDGQGLAFWTDDPSSFPPLELSYFTPSTVTNAIVDLGTVSNYDFSNVINQLDILGCKDVELRIFKQTTITEIENLLNIINDRGFRSVELIYPFYEFSLKDAGNLVQQFPIIFRVSIHSAPETLFVAGYKSDFGTRGDIVMTQQVITNQHHCGFVSPDSFSINIETFTESQRFNSCLNKKVSVDCNGDIKNCPSMNEGFGNVNNVSIIDVVNFPAFQKMWRIAKDQISVCKDCEFRHVCTDCRANLSENENILSKPLQCRYDPYSATWQ